MLRTTLYPDSQVALVSYHLGVLQRWEGLELGQIEILNFFTNIVVSDLELVEG